MHYDRSAISFSVYIQSEPGGAASCSPVVAKQYPYIQECQEYPVRNRIPRVHGMVYAAIIYLLLITPGGVQPVQAWSSIQPQLGLPSRGGERI